MPDNDPPRSLAARAAAELALIRIVNHYGGRPEFVLLGGLVPALLCTGPDARHAGTTDVDVQVDLEIAGGAANAARLEHALRNARFTPDSQHIWRWRADTGSQPVKSSSNCSPTLKLIRQKSLSDLTNARIWER
jgi:hypothetical protein